MFPVRFVISFIGLPFNVATYSKSSNLVSDVLIYLLNLSSTLIRYTIILQDAAFCSFILFEVELLIYGLS